MRKTIILMIIILSLFITYNVSACDTDSNCYEYYLQNDNDFYFNYYIDFLDNNYINKDFKIIVPKNINTFKKYDYIYKKWLLNNKSKYYNTIRLHNELKKRGLEGLIY